MLRSARLRGSPAGVLRALTALVRVVPGVAAGVLLPGLIRLTGLVLLARLTALTRLRRAAPRLILLRCGRRGLAPRLLLLLRCGRGGLLTPRLILLGRGRGSLLAPGLLLLLRCRRRHRASGRAGSCGTTGGTESSRGTHASGVLLRARAEHEEDDGREDHEEEEAHHQQRDDHDGPREGVRLGADVHAAGELADVGVGDGV